MESLPYEVASIKYQMRRASPSVGCWRAVNCDRDHIFLALESYQPMHVAQAAHATTINNRNTDRSRLLRILRIEIICSVQRYATST